MNGITHRQAMKWIDRRQDGLLKENQRLLLEEHLRSCDSCRLYSDEMEQLASRLTGEFQARWQDDPGPSRSVVANVAAKAKEIPVAKRFSYGLSLLGGLAVLVVLGVVINFFVSQLKQSSPVANGTQSVSSFPQAENRLLAFSSVQGANSDIYTMHADGSGLTNITNNPAYDGFPHWSPDGKRIAFESGRDGSNQIYLMDADGSNVIRLTDGQNPNGILDSNIGNGFLGGTIQDPWSPDGRKLIISRNSIGELNHQFYVLDVATKNIIPLTKDAGKFYSPSWSPDGEHIAFLLDETTPNSPILQHLYMVDSQGNHLTDLTEDLSGDESVSLADYYWSPDGTSLTFVADSQQGIFKSTVYKVGLDGSRVQVTQTNGQILDWWNGTALQQDLPQKVEKTSFSIVAADGSLSSLGTCQSSDRPVAYLVKRSSDGTLAFGFHCLPSGWTFYRANPDGTLIRKLLSLPLDSKYDSVFDMVWAPDNPFLAFMAVDEERVEFPDLYIINANDPSAQPLKMENSSSPSWQPVVNENLVKEKSPVNLTIDPQSCKPAEGDSIPSELYGLDVIQNTSFIDGDFTYDFWLYCDPALKPEDPEHLSAIAGLGIYSTWRYAGPQADGPVRYHYAFEPDQPFGESGSVGPLYKASATEKLGIDLSETSIREYIHQGLPIQFSVVVDSSLGQDGAVLSFALEPTQDGVRVLDAHTERIKGTVGGNLIAFTSLDENGNTDIYTVHPDGSGLVNLTNNAAKESYLAWSPDGRRLVFSSGQDGKWDLFSMNADGSDLTRLTEDPGGEAFSLWSPDGKRIAYTLYEPDQKTANVYVMDANGENQRRLTDRRPDPDAYGVWADVWSLDSRSIFYSEQDQINKFNIENGEITQLPVRMSSFLTQGNDSKLQYFSACNGNAGVFCFTPQTIAEDGTGKETHQTIALQEVCTTKSSPSAKMIDYYYLTKWSPDRTKIIFQFNCSDLGQLFYLANADGSGFRPLLSDFLPTGIGLNYDIDLDWSPDSRSIIFTSSLDDPESQDLCILNVEEALQNPESKPSPLHLATSQAGFLAWQPASNNVTVKETPTPEPVQASSYHGLVAFMSEQSGNQEIYTMRADGSQLKDLTNNPANDYGPLWSPDGGKTAFVSDRTGNEDIFIMDPDGNNLIQLTDNPGNDGYLSWSPDGKKIVYVMRKKDINQEGRLALMDADGGNQMTLTGPGDYLLLGWSPDSRKIVYIKQPPDAESAADNMVVVINTDGTGYHEWNAVVDGIQWEDDGHFVGFGWNGQVESPDLGWVLRRFNTNGDSPVEIASYSSRIVEIRKDTHVVAGGSILAWYTSDGSPAPFTSWNSAEVCRGTGSQFMPSSWTSTAPDGSKALIVIPCESGKIWFYVNPLDGSPIRTLTDFSVDSVQGGGPGWSWSLDGKYGIMTVSNPNGGQGADFYLFDIEQMLNDPSVQPVRITSDNAVKYGVVWRPTP
jgi:Tol biopolymer transport system component